MCNKPNVVQVATSSRDYNFLTFKLKVDNITDIRDCSKLFSVNICVENQFKFYNELVQSLAVMALY